MTATESASTTDSVEVASPSTPGDADESSPTGSDVSVASGMKALIAFARPDAGRFVLAGLLAAAAALLSLVPFWAIYRTIDAVVAGDPIRNELFRLALITLIALVGRYVLFGLSTAVSHVAAYQMLYEIRVAMAERLGRVPLGYVNRRRSGEIKKVMGDDVERLELWLAHGIPDIVASLVVAVAVPVWLFTVDWRMAIATLIVILPAFAAMAIGMRRTMPSMPRYHESLTEMNASVVELIRGMPVVKVFNRADDRVRDTENAIERHVTIVERLSRDSLPLMTAFFVLLAANVALLVPLGIWLNDRGSLSDTDMLFFFVVGLGALGPISALLSLFAHLAQLTTGGNLVEEIMTAPTLTDGDADLIPGDASVELHEVDFAYDERRVLHGVSLRAEPGTITALVGPSGSGKSTIAALIARFWDIDGGEIRVGGVDIRSLDPDVLAANVSVVLQDTFLFDDTIAANLRVARPNATDAEIEAAARAARAHDFVTAFPAGYETVVGERGARLSGGERQRLTLARAILADAPVILLDEATSFADPENEALIQDAIGELIAGKTVIMIAHRLSTIAGADQILVIEDGRVVERGRHDELVAATGTYARLWDDFISAEDLALGDAVRRDP
ncbi:MAG: ABC transporter ATP-binding protein [Actinomycetota bacterium]